MISWYYTVGNIFFPFKIYLNICLDYELCLPSTGIFDQNIIFKPKPCTLGFEHLMRNFHFILYYREQNMKYFIHQNLMISLLFKNLFYKTTSWFIQTLSETSKVFTPSLRFVYKMISLKFDLTETQARMQLHWLSCLHYEFLATEVTASRR